MYCLITRITIVNPYQNEQSIYKEVWMILGKVALSRKSPTLYLSVNFFNSSCYQEYSFQSQYEIILPSDRWNRIQWEQNRWFLLFLRELFQGRNREEDDPLPLKQTSNHHDTKWERYSLRLIVYSHFFNHSIVSNTIRNEFNCIHCSLCIWRQIFIECRTDYSEEEMRDRDKELNVWDMITYFSSFMWFTAKQWGWWFSPLVAF